DADYDRLFADLQDANLDFATLDFDFLLLARGESEIINCRDRPDAAGYAREFQKSGKITDRRLFARIIPFHPAHGVGKEGILAGCAFAHKSGLRECRLGGRTIRIWLRPLERAAQQRHQATPNHTPESERALAKGC